MWDEITELSILYDFYGDLLPERVREIFRLYHEENLSLAEIAEQYDISRQGVHENVRRAEERLRGYEEKLGLAKRFLEQEAVLDRLRVSVDELRTRIPNDALVASMAKDIASLSA